MAGVAVQQPPEWHSCGRNGPGQDYPDNLADCILDGGQKQLWYFLPYLLILTTGPYLVIVPLATMPNWIIEFERWTPTLNVLAYRGTKSSRRELLVLSICLN